MFDGQKGVFKSERHTVGEPQTLKMKNFIVRFDSEFLRYFLRGVFTPGKAKF
jgi:hypothetical protein